VRSVGVQLLLTAGSSSICTWEAESFRDAQVSFHWPRPIETVAELAFALSRNQLPRKFESDYICMENEGGRSRGWKERLR